MPASSTVLFIALVLFCGCLSTLIRLPRADRFTGKGLGYSQKAQALSDAEYDLIDTTDKLQSEKVKRSNLIQQLAKIRTE